MIIYFAGGMPFMKKSGEERRMWLRVGVWNRLYSYHYLVLNNNYILKKSQIIELKKEYLQLIRNTNGKK